MNDDSLAENPSPSAPVPATAAETNAENPWPLRLLAEKLKAHIERAPVAWVEGQLIEFNRRGQNAFMTLRDVDAEVSLSASAWGNVVPTHAPGLEPGARVVAQLRPQMWLKTGRLSMNTLAIQPVGEGDLLARIEKLRRALSEEGLFSASRKRPLPALPQRIGLITGRDSDAEKDILRNASLRWPLVNFQVRNVAVQGARAVAEISTALKELDADPEVDLIIIARGGGALEDLLPFSDESLVRLVAAAHTPVVSAIGHEADRPILDDVADLRASTPTDAAKRVVPDLGEEMERVHEARHRMNIILANRISVAETEIDALRSRPVMLRPASVFENHHEAIEQLMARGRMILSHLLTSERSRTEHTLARVRALSPQSTLKRGYAVVQSEDGAVITRAASVSAGQQLRLLVASGSIQAEATTIEPS